MKTKLLNTSLLIVRLVVGWHFLYEGISKLFIPGWSSKYYLEGSLWIFKNLFGWIASNPTILGIADFLNIWGLTLIGLALIFGAFTRLAALSGTLMLLMYFVAYPPIPGYTFGGFEEGSYLWINKNVVEMAMLLFLAIFGGKELWGIDRIYATWRKEKAYRPIPSYKEERRSMLRDLIGIPVLGAFAYACYKKNKWESFERKHLIANGETDAVTSATVRAFEFTRLEELKGQVPKGTIKGVEISKMIMGGNLIGGWSHARDLIYTDKLVKAYHTDEKVMQTLLLGEKCGMNSILINPQLGRIINKYRRELKSNIKFISDCGINLNFFEGIDRSIQEGADLLYCQGEITDRWSRDEEHLEMIAKGIEKIRENGLPAGIGAHRIESIKACVKFGIKPDYWVKTLHHHDYWSVGPKDWTKLDYADPANEYKDNVFCFNPEETINFMNSLDEPFIAFKVLAAGAIKPEDGFKYAFDNGADFICVGMYDFQIVDDTNILLDTLPKINRPYPWRG